MLKIRRYKDLNYTSIFNPKTGFFARIENEGKKEPFWSPHGPELIDIAITNWCDKGCSFCYRKSNIQGQHMPFNHYKSIIDFSAKIGVFQVALGGGNPNQHPDFIKILSYTSQKGIIPNYTTNGRGLSEKIVKSSKDNCGVVAVSAYEPYNETAEAIKKLTKASVKTNLHFILDVNSISTALNWLHDPPLFLENINAIIFLNYKPLGNKIDYSKLLKNSTQLKTFFRTAITNRYKFKIGFDACSVSGIFSLGLGNQVTIDACDAGRFSMFISENLRAYPCSFQEQLSNGDQIIENGNFIDIWLKSKNFDTFRKYYSSVICTTCINQKYCLNGCAIFNELKLCNHYI